MCCFTLAVLNSAAASAVTPGTVGMTSVLNAVTATGWTARPAAENRIANRSGVRGQLAWYQRFSLCRVPKGYARNGGGRHG